MRQRIGNLVGTAGSLTPNRSGGRLTRCRPRTGDLRLIIDIHTHTFPTSDDSTLTPEELINEAKRTGLDGICITDHDGFWSPNDVLKLAQAHDYLVLPGCEVTTEEGHLLVYGLERYIFGMHRAAFVKDLVAEAGGAIVVAHPYRRVFREAAASDGEAYAEMLDRACRNVVFPMSDAVEVLNGRGSAPENAFAGNMAKRLEMKGTGASDAHKLDDLGSFATEFEGPVTCLDDFIAELRAGRFAPVVMDARLSRTPPLRARS